MKTTDDLKDDFEGKGEDLTESFFRNGLIWSKELDQNGNRKYLYGRQYVSVPGGRTEPTQYGEAFLPDDMDVRNLFKWVDFERGLKSEGIATEDDLDQWLSQSTPHKIATLVHKFGAEMVFGPPTTAQGTPIFKPPREPKAKTEPELKPNLSESAPAIPVTKPETPAVPATAAPAVAVPASPVLPAESKPAVDVKPAS